MVTEWDHADAWVVRSAACVQGFVFSFVISFSSCRLAVPRSLPIIKSPQSQN